MSDPLPEAVAAQIKAALAGGNKIEAIKVYREFSQVGLAEAKSFIEALIERGVAPVARHPEAEPSEIEAALLAGNKIGAIKLYRERHRVGLAEAKQQVEALEDQLGLNLPGRFVAKKGCLVIAIASLGAGTGLLFALGR